MSSVEYSFKRLDSRFFRIKRLIDIRIDQRPFLSRTRWSTSDGRLTENPAFIFVYDLLSFGLHCIVEPFHSHQWLMIFVMIAMVRLANGSDDRQWLPGGFLVRQRWTRKDGWMTSVIAEKVCERRFEVTQHRFCFVGDLRRWVRRRDNSFRRRAKSYFRVSIATLFRHKRSSARNLTRFVNCGRSSDC